MVSGSGKASSRKSAIAFNSASPRGSVPCRQAGSTTWSRMQREGSNDAAALCAMYDTVRPRKARSWRAPSESTSTSPMRTLPPLMRQPRRAWPISASAVVVLPEPDSPISASTSPGRMVKLNASTSAALPALTLSLSTTTNAPISAPSSFAGRAARQVVDDQVDGNRQAGNGDRRRDDRGTAAGERFDVLAHQRAPVGRGRLYPKSKKAQAGQQQHHVH